MSVNLLYKNFSSMYLLLLLLLMPFKINAHQTTIELVTGLPKPPFIIGNEGQGMQLDLIRAAFALADIKVKFIHLPLARTISGYQQWHADGVITLPSNTHPEGMFISSPYIVYQNVAVSLAQKQLKVESVADLAGKKVTAFQNAKNFLGRVYEQAIASNNDYFEFADQSKQIASLFARHSEVIVLDESIFKYMMQMNKDHKMYQKDYQVHYIFSPRHYSAGFKNQQHRALFDQGIKQLEQSGQYQQIIANYLH